MVIVKSGEIVNMFYFFVFYFFSISTLFSSYSNYSNLEEFKNEIKEMESRRDEDSNIKKLRERGKKESKRDIEQAKTNPIRPNRYILSDPDPDKFGMEPEKGDILPYLKYDSSHNGSNFVNGVDAYTVDTASGNEPIMINQKQMPPTYHPKDYPYFNIDFLFQSELSLGERERIKKALIIIKILLNSDNFRILFLSTFKNLGPDYYGRFKLDEKTKVPFGSSDLYKHIVDFNELIYISKDYVRSHYVSGGFNQIIYHYGGKGISIYHPYIPISLFHEILHCMNLSHPKGGKMPADSIQSIDASVHISMTLFSEVLYDSKIPNIPYTCYSGISEEWNTC